MSFTVKPINLFDNTTVYDQTKTTLNGKITTKTLAGKTVIGPPIVKYRNTITGPEAITPAEVTITENNRVFVMTLESSGLVTIALYDIVASNGDLNYVGKVVVQIPEPPTTTYAVRGFKVLDDGTTDWKLFILYTANVTAHSGLYMVNGIGLSDFNFVATSFPTATAPGQSAVYKLDDSPFSLTNGAGIMLDTDNDLVYVQRGASPTMQFLVFDYGATITTVGSLGETTDLYLYTTGVLPTLTGTLLLTNSIEYTTPTSGPNSGNPCVIFHTTTTMYRGALSDLTSGATTWPSLEFANNLGPVNNYVSQNALRATFSEPLQRVIILLGSSSAPATIMVKQFANDNQDLICTVLSADNNEATAREMYKFKSPIAPIGFDARVGYLAIISATSGARGIYTAAFDVDDIYDLTSIISPVLDIRNEQVFNFTAGFVRPDFASPLVVCYRTSGFASPTGGWVMAPEDFDFGGISSPSGYIQIKITFRVFVNDTTNGLQLYNAGLITRNVNAISEYWEYSHDDSTPGLPSVTGFRLKKSYPVSVPTLVFRATDLSDNVYVQSDTVADAGLFEYSTDGGVNWLALGTIPNTIGTLLRYTFAVPPGIDVRPSLRED